MFSMPGLNEIALSLWVGLESFFLPLVILQLVGGLLARRVLRHAIPTGWRLVTLRALIFLQQQCQLLLTLWVILFFYFGVLSVRAVSYTHLTLPTTPYV